MQRLFLSHDRALKPLWNQMTGSGTGSPPPLRMAGRATKENDLTFIRIGDEPYEIPDAVVLGE